MSDHREASANSVFLLTCTSLSLLSDYSVEDNVAVATRRAVSPAEVRKVCMQANAHEDILHLTVRQATSPQPNPNHTHSHTPTDREQDVGEGRLGGW